MTVSALAANVSGGDVVQYVLGGILIALAVVLVALILKQTGKEKSLSGTITGGSTDTYFGKSGGASLDKWLSRLTVIGSVLFVVIAIVLTILIYAAQFTA